MKKTISEAELTRLKKSGAVVRRAQKSTPKKERVAISPEVVATVEAASVLSDSIRKSREVNKQSCDNIVRSVENVSKEIRDGNKKKRFAFKIQRDHRGLIATVDVREL